MLLSIKARSEYGQFSFRVRLWTGTIESFLSLAGMKYRY